MSDLTLLQLKLIGLYNHVDKIAIIPVKFITAEHFWNNEISLELRVGWLKNI